MSSWWKREPALILGLIQAALVVGVSFGLQLTPDQITALAGLNAAIFALITRQNVSSKATSETLAKGTLQKEATPEQERKAAAVLGLGVSHTIPAELKNRAMKVSDWLPQPVGIIFDLVGEAGLMLAVETAEKAMRRAPNPDELKQGADLEAEERFGL